MATNVIGRSIAHEAWAENRVRDDIATPLTTPQRPARRRLLQRSGWGYVATFAVTAVLIAAVTGWLIARERSTTLAYWQVRQRTATDVMASRVANWVKRNRTNAEVLATSPGISSKLAGMTGESADSRASMHRQSELYLAHAAAAYHYQGIYVLDTAGRVVSQSPNAPPLEAAAIAVAESVARGQDTRLDLYGEIPEHSLASFTAPVHLPVDGPGAGGTGFGAVVGSVMLVTSLTDALFPLLSGETVPTDTGETLLVRRDGNDTVYINPLRHRPALSAQLRIPSEKTPLPSQRAFTNETGVIEAIDYRGVIVLAAARQLPEIGWGLVHKIDRDEALASFHFLVWLECGFAGLLLLAVAILLRTEWQRERIRSHALQIDHRFRALIERSLDLVAILDGDGTYRYANPAHEAAYGIEPSELVGKRAFDTVHPDDARKIVPLLAEAIRTGTFTATVEFRIRHQDSSWHTIEGIAVNLFDDPEVAGLLVTGRDVTEHKRAEERLRLQSSALEAAANAIVITDASGIIQWVNPAFTKLTGYAAAEAVGRNPRELVKSGKHDPAFYKNLWDTICAGQVWQGEMINRRKDGTFYNESQSITPVWDDNQRISNFVAIKEDITARRQMEEHLHLAQKMEALGTLAGGVAHDFNNILGAILGNVGLALQDVGPGHVATESLIEIRKASHRARDLVQRILAFGRQQQEPQGSIALRPLVEEALAMLRPTLPAGVELAVLFAPTVTVVRADPTQIHQLVMNLCTNAGHAIKGDHGRIEISLDAVTVDAEVPGIPFNLRPGRFARLTVSDSGVGMDASTLGRIFDPFFTTKPVGQGTGLGLSIVHGIMKAHGGTITVNSEPGAGTTFSLYFPEAEAGSASPAPEVIEAAPPRGADDQRVLYLDDDESLVFLTVRLLERLGISVSGYSRAEEALAAFRADPSQFDLVVTDLNMPGMSGLEVAGEVLSLRPDVPVLLVSGYITDELRASAALRGVRDLIYKPSTADEIAEVVRRLVSRPKTS